MANDIPTAAALGNPITDLPPVLPPGAKLLVRVATKGAPYYDEIACQVEVGVKNVTNSFWAGWDSVVAIELASGQIIPYCPIKLGRKP